MAGEWLPRLHFPNDTPSSLSIPFFQLLCAYAQDLAGDSLCGVPILGHLMYAVGERVNGRTY
jgi:hypothetical protein